MATIYGDLFHNTLDANDGVTSGSDTIFGYNGNDALYGLGGNDFLWGGWAGIWGDLLDGGSGSDTAVYLDSSVSVIADLGLGEGFTGTAEFDVYVSIENLTGSLFGDILVGDGEGNVLTGDFGDDALIGQGGNDTLIGGAGADELIGGSETDTASYITALFGIAASLASGEGTIGDALGDTFETIENLTGSSFADTLTGDANANVLDGYGGNDELKGGGGADTLEGGTGTDTALYTDSGSAVTVNLISGLGFGGTAEGDTLDDIENVTGSIYADTLTGDANANRLFGSNGDDTLKGGGGADTLEGGSGIDTVQYSDSASGVTVSLLVGSGSGGTAEDDTFSSIENVLGSIFDDHLSGDAEDNSLSGGSGDDWLKGGGGADTLDGGTGNDTATYLNHGGGVTVSLATGTGTAGDALGDVLTEIENLYGTVYADTLFGDSGANILHGDGGDDVLKGAGGTDRLIGGSGVDTATYLGSTAVAVNLTTGTASGGWAQGDTLTDIENVVGSSSGDILVGDTQANSLFGEGGNDLLWGGAGADTLDGGGDDDVYLVDNAGDTIIENGGEGTDTVLANGSYVLAGGADIELLAAANPNGTAAIDLTGSTAGNVVRGNAGNNVINGGGGRDTLTGLGGADSFLFDSALDAAFNVDVITDFNVADDTILLDQTIFSSSLGLGNISAGELVIGAAALDANDRIIYDNSNGALSYDSDGAGGNAAIQFAVLSQGLTLTSLDFLVVA